MTKDREEQSEAVQAEDQLDQQAQNQHAEVEFAEDEYIPSEQRQADDELAGEMEQSAQAEPEVTDEQYEEDQAGDSQQSETEETAEAADKSTAEAGDDESTAEEKDETDGSGRGNKSEKQQEPGIEPEEDFEVTMQSVVEAVLFASDEPLTDARLANIAEATTKQVRQAVKDLNQMYRSNGHAFRIDRIAGGNQMMTLSPYNHWLKKMLHARSDSKLSPAALETLAIVAYKQPIIRADIEAIRGVAVGEVMRSLMYKGLVKIVGRAELVGRPMLYGTTKKFLEVFGLNSLKDLPKIEELKKPKEQTSESESETGSDGPSEASPQIKEEAAETAEQSDDTGPDASNDKAEAMDADEHVESEDEAPVSGQVESDDINEESEETGEQISREA